MNQKTKQFKDSKDDNIQNVIHNFVSPNIILVERDPEIMNHHLRVSIYEICFKNDKLSSDQVHFEIEKICI